MSPDVQNSDPMSPRRPPAPAPSRPAPTRLRRFRWSLALVAISVAAYWGATFAQYVTSPVYGVSFSARAAQWGRDHGLGSVVGWAEQQVYSLSPPRVGGRPPRGAFGAGGARVTTDSVHRLSPPPRLVSPAGPPLPGEGVWHPVGRTASNGSAAVYEAFVRPDSLHTSYVAGLAWMDPSLLRATLYSGSYIPGGGPYTKSAPISYGTSTSLVAAFNAGFRMENAHGGYYTDRRVVVPLRRGAASAVILRNGRLTVGAWGRDNTLTSNVVAVRQNLNLIVDHGQVVSAANLANSSAWGATLGGGDFVWRSGLGVTANGAVVYAAGPSLSIATLAQLFVTAGCVRAMELDINPDWVQFSAYHGARNAAINGGDGTSLLNNMIGSPSRYFKSWWNRDFFTMSLRSTATTSSGQPASARR